MSKLKPSVKVKEQDELIVSPSESAAAMSGKNIIPFELFYKKFNNVGEIVQSEEWKNCYSHFYKFSPVEYSINIHEDSDEIEQYDFNRQQEEYRKCISSFQYFCHKYVKIIHPTYGLIPCILYKYQQRVVRDYDKSRFTILKKFRQGGLTTISVLKGWWECMFRTDRQVLVMSKTDREAIGSGEIMKTALKHLPQWLVPKMGKSNDHERHFLETGSRMWFYTPEAARSKSISWVIIDEAAHIDGMSDHWKAMYPVISTGGACAVISTVNGLGNWYEQIYHQAEAKKNQFHIIDLNYWEHPQYAHPNWEKENRPNIGEKGWAQEILGTFLGGGETFIPSDIVMELSKKTQETQPVRTGFENWRNSDEDLKFNWQDAALFIWQEPKEEHEYIVAADCAEGVGKEGDNSCFQILDMNTLEQVAEFYSNLVPPNVFGQILFKISTYYNTALLVIENTGIGGAVMSTVYDDLGYENVYTDMKVKRNKPGIILSKNTRPQYLECFQNRILNNTVTINSIRLATELKTFVFNAKTHKAEARKGYHDDAIMSLSMALKIRDTLIRDLPAGVRLIENDIKTYNPETLKEIRNEIFQNDIDMDFVEEFIGTMGGQDDLPEMIFRRKHESILREFGW